MEASVMSYDQVLSEVYNSTYKMLALAQGRQWDELMKAESCRSELLQKLKIYKRFEIDCEIEIEKKLREIIEVNQLITFLSIQEKDNCMSEIKLVRASKKATSEYSRY